MFAPRHYNLICDLVRFGADVIVRTAGRGAGADGRCADRRRAGDRFRRRDHMQIACASSTTAGEKQQTMRRISSKIHPQPLLHTYVFCEALSMFAHPTTPSRSH